MSRILTGPQKAALKNLAIGRESSWGLSGRSAFGGHTRTMLSLYQAGFVDKNYEITQAGRNALQPRKARIEMTKNDFDFETWFDSLAAMVLDGCGVDFRDVESVRDDYNGGKNCADVADEIIAEYNIE